MFSLFLRCLDLRYLILLLPYSAPRSTLFTNSLGVGVIRESGKRSSQGERMAQITRSKDFPHTRRPSCLYFELFRSNPPPAATKSSRQIATLAIHSASTMLFLYLLATVLLAYFLRRLFVIYFSVRVWT